ncbi:MAG: PQQ-binding-like beta-propeller repeat protein, partial [Planctomycetes bacterium]|nr:PQQ-binding-like beta-propeller repeat protein [Planctomycetota bacterium]
MNAGDSLAAISQRVTAVAVCVLPFAADAVGQHDQWPMFQRYATHRGQVGVDGPDDTPYWQQALSRAVTRSSPTIDDDLVFVVDSRPVVSGSQTWPLDALWWYDGSVAWSIDTLGPCKMTPAVAGGRVFVANQLGDVIAFELSDRSIAWFRNYADEDIAAVTVVAGKLYFPYQHYLRSLDAGDGSDRWQFETGTWYGTASTGHMARSPGSEGKVWSAPAVAQGYVVIGCENGRIYAVDENKSGNREYLWSSPLHSSGQDRAVFGSAAIDGDLVFVGGDGHFAYAFDLLADVHGDGLDNDANGVPDDEGEVLWSYDAGEKIRCTPAVGGGRVVFTTVTDRLFCLD